MGQTNILESTKGAIFSHNLPTPSPNISNVCSSIWKFLPGGVRTHNMLSAEKPTWETFSQHKKRQILLTLCSDTWYRWYLIQIKLFYQSLCHLIVRRGFHSPGGVFLLKINPEGGLQKNCNWKKKTGEKSKTKSGGEMRIFEIESRIKLQLNANKQCFEFSFSKLWFTDFSFWKLEMQLKSSQKLPLHVHHIAVHYSPKVGRKLSPSLESCFSWLQSLPAWDVLFVGIQYKVV